VATGITLTSISGAAAGDIIMSSSPKLPFRMDPGSHLTVKVTTAGGASTGDFRPFLVYRVAGFPDAKSTLETGHTLTFKAS